MIYASHLRASRETHLRVTRSRDMLQIKLFVTQFVTFILCRLVARASTLRENAEESVVGMKRDTDVEAG